MKYAVSTVHAKNKIYFKRKFKIISIYCVLSETYCTSVDVNAFKQYVDTNLSLFL